MEKHFTNMDHVVAFRPVPKTDSNFTNGNDGGYIWVG